MNSPKKKLIIGWFTFTCSEDSSILMTELLNQHWQNWQDKLEFKYAKLFRKSLPLGPMDIAFIEGAISSDQQAKKLKTIRSLAKTLVAVGSCAVTGQPSAQRNLFNPDQIKTIKPILERFQYADNVRKVSDVVSVNHTIPGCPMDENKFIELLNQLINNSAANTDK
jgi:coenzyme F420-reducing hydrogenase gamma subunit